MGKVKKNKKASRPNPTTEVPQEDELLVLREGDDDSFIENTITKLKSGKDEDRETGCENLCIAADRHIPRIIETGLLRILGPLLLDPNQNVRRSAVGALKNLSLSSENPSDIVEEMMKADVLTPLLALFEKFFGDVDDEEILIQSVHLLWNLCESSSVALERAFQQLKLLEFLLTCLNKFPRVKVPILQCLLTVSEDNPGVDAYLEERKEALRDMIVNSSSSAEERILACGILLNILSAEGKENELRLILETVATTLDMDHRVMIGDFSKTLTSRKDNEEIISSDKSRMDTEESLDKEVSSLLNAQQTSLEILTNLFCDEDDEDNASLEDEEDDFQEEFMSNGSQMNEDYASSIPPTVIHAIKEHHFLDKLLQKAILPPSEIVERLKESLTGKDLLKTLQSLRSKAFICLNNILLGTSSMPLKELFAEGYTDDRIFEIWTELGTLCFGESGEKDSSVLEAAISALRALTTRLCQAGCSKLSSLSFQDLNMMLELSNKGNYGGDVRINVVHIVGDLGASSHLGDEVTKALTNFLLETASKDSDVAVCAEALDKVFDMYAEDETDELAVGVSLVPRLKGLTNGFKVKSGRMPKKDQRYPLIHTAKVNLNRFIKYKSKRPLIAKSL